MSNTDTNGSVELDGLTEDEVLELLASGRVRNAYAPKVELFVQSDELGIDPAKEWPVDFGNKQATTLMQGFNTAVGKLGLEDVIQVIKRGDRCVLINKARVAIKAQEKAEAATATAKK